MARKKIFFHIPNDIVKEIEVIARQEQMSQVKVIHLILRSHLDSKLLRETMKNGYQDMGKINSDWAEMYSCEEYEELSAYELWLKELKNE